VQTSDSCKQPLCGNGLHLIMHWTIGQMGYIRPLTLTPSPKWSRLYGIAWNSCATCRQWPFQTWKSVWFSLVRSMVVTEVGVGG